MYCMSLRLAPADDAMSIPSPSDIFGLVVFLNFWPIPPVARMTAFARISYVQFFCSSWAIMPIAWPFFLIIFIAFVCSRISISGFLLTAFIRVFSTIAPVLSPACATRKNECPPSRRAFLSNFIPRDSNRAIARGAFFTRYSTADFLFLKCPATSVSFMWLANESFGSNTAAIPPCAFAVAESMSRFFVIKSTFPYLEADNAKLSPAIPEPITKNLTDDDSNVVVVREIFS